MSAILKEKTFPSQYPVDAVKVLKTMSFTDGKEIQIIGSQSLRSQLYAGDYDAYEVVEGKFPTRQDALKHYAKEFQDIVSRLKKMKNVYIGDIKSGIIEEWRVIPKTGRYKLRDATTKVESLLSAKIITPKEAKDALSVLRARPTPLDILKAKDKIKFHIVRWSPEEVLKGHKTLRDGRNYSLEEAFGSPTITKLDVIALIQSRYTELSLVYEFHNGDEVLNPDIIDPEKSLNNSIELLKAEGNLFKVVKRKFALAKLRNDLPKVIKYNEILNSDLGKLYVVYSDIKTLVELLEDNDVPTPEINNAIAGFKHRLARIYSLEDYLKTETTILNKLDSAMKKDNPLPILSDIKDQLLAQLSKATHLYGGELHY
jgi:hypothetical protein